MMNNMRHAAAAFALVGMAALSACSDSPVGIDEDLDEGVERIQLVMNSQTIAEFDGSSWSGDLDVTAGSSTAPIGVRLIDHDGNVFTPPSAITLGVDITNESVARWEQGSTGALGGQLRGVASGTTMAVFKLMRGIQVEYATTPVRVDVNMP